MKVFTILISYFDEKLGRSTIEHFKSIECIGINAELLFGEILNAFVVDNIPSENLLSDLSDSASYVRRGKCGTEKVIDNLSLIKLCALIKMILNLNFD